MNCEILEDMFYYHNKYRNVDIHSIGCELSEWDAEHIIDVIGSPDNEIIIFNTCSVTERAEKASKVVVDMISKIYPNKKMYITGCGVQHDLEYYKRYGICLDNYEKFNKNNYPKCSYYGTFRHSIDTDERYIKVQDGCKNNCTYCAVKLFRNKPYSIPYEEIKYQLNDCIANNQYKIHIIGTEITEYYSEGMYIDGLIRRILEDYPDIQSVSFDALDPSSKRVEALIDMIGTDYRFEKTLYLSVQSASDKVLRDMKRKYNIKRVEELCDYARKYPYMEIDVDLITGYPTETREDFELTKEFVKKYKIREVNICPFSKREGTEAYNLEDVYTRQEKLDRARELFLISKIPDMQEGIETVDEEPSNCYELNLYLNDDVIEYIKKYCLNNYDSKNIISFYNPNASDELKDNWEINSKILTLLYGVNLYVKDHKTIVNKDEFADYFNCTLVEE